MPDDTLLANQHEGRRRFLELVADLRPELHRYCARMTGSIADGEDIVQDTLARAYYLLPEMNELPAFRPWLFRIAHNRALDHLRRYEARMGEPLDAVRDTAVDPAREMHAKKWKTRVGDGIDESPHQLCTFRDEIVVLAAKGNDHNVRFFSAHAADPVAE